MSYLILGAALELAKYLGPSYAAGFLKDCGVSPDVVEELLKKEFQLYHQREANPTTSRKHNTAAELAESHSLSRG